MRETTGPTRQRLEMVERQLAARGIRDPRVLDAMRQVPREEFVPAELVAVAYEDGPLPIDENQTISQPYIVALMCEALELRGGERVLEIGAGSGYSAAVLARLAAQVVTLERHAALAADASRKLRELGLGNVEVVHADGSVGWPPRAPYEAITVAAGGPEVPAALLAQLAPGGRLVIPVGPTLDEQVLLRVRMLAGGGIRREELGAVRFVPLVGEQGWDAEAAPTRSAT